MTMDLPMPLPSNDLLGWVAALLTLMTFVCRDMRRLRLLALHLAPVPVKLWRLNQTLRPVLRRGEAALSMTPPEPVRAQAARPRRGWTHGRRRRAGASRSVSPRAAENPRIRRDCAFADVTAIRQ